MRVPAHHWRNDISENMMTSMIDVVFLLLIFFVCAAAGNVYELLLPTRLPAAGAVPSMQMIEQDESALPVDKILIFLSIGEAGQTVMELNGTAYETFGKLRNVLLGLAAIVPENPVVLDIAPDVSAGEFVRVYDTCRAAGFKKINFGIKRRNL